MAGINLGTALAALQALGPLAAAAPQFKALWDQIAQTFDKDTDQETLKHAYDLAIGNASEAHGNLQDLVRRHGG